MSSVDNAPATNIPIELIRKAKLKKPCSLDPPKIWSIHLSAITEILEKIATTIRGLQYFQKPDISWLVADETDSLLKLFFQFFFNNKKLAVVINIITIISL